MREGTADVGIDDMTPDFIPKDADEAEININTDMMQGETDKCSPKSQKQCLISNVSDNKEL